MYYISDDFNNACNNYVRTWHSKCVINEGKASELTIFNGTPENCLGAIRWESSINADDALAMGQTGMDKITIEITRLQSGYNLQHATFHPYVGIEIDNNTVWCPLGIFYADDVTTDDNYFTTTVTAYDGMSLLSETFDEADLGITFPISARQLLIAIATRFNLTINATTYTILRSLEGYMLRDSIGRILVVDSLRQSIGDVYEGTYRDYIGWIAGLQGCNAHFDRDGAIAFSYYGDSVMTVNPSVIYMNGLTLNKGGTVTYTSFLSGTEEHPVVPTRYSGNAIVFMNPYVTASDLDSLGDNILPITYQPCELHYRGNPCLDVGDRITVNDAKGNTHNVFIMQRTLSMTGGLDDTVQCFGMTEEQATLDSSPMSRKIKQLYNNLQKAVKEASDYINNTSGVFEWIDNGDGTNGGFIIKADNNSSLIKCTAGGLGVSLDGGVTFQNAITRNGINASVIRTGILNADYITIEQSGSNSDIDITNGVISFSTADDVKQLELSSRGIKVYYGGTEIGRFFREAERLSVLMSKDATSFNIMQDTTGDGTYDRLYMRIKTDETEKYAEFQMLDNIYFRSPVQMRNTVYLNGVGLYMGNDNSSALWGDSTGMSIRGGGTTNIRFKDTEMTAYVDLNMNYHNILNQSDIRLKENVSATPVKALDTIDGMRFVAFDWKENKQHEDLGLIAQELQKINPSMVVDTGEYLAVNTSKFVMYALKAIQELSQQIKDMKGADA